MNNIFALAVIFLVGMAGGVSAQQRTDANAWVQIEALPNLAAAQERARSYAARLTDVNGFALSARWYGILLGPYLRAEAEQVLRAYRADGAIPRDSFIAFSRDLKDQFWPASISPSQGAVIAPPAPAPAPALTETTPQIPPADETRSQARLSEGRLSASERRDLQAALRAAGFYNAAVDGAFGAGTRRSMAAWQTAQGVEATGVLTTAQRQQLMQDYNAPLISVGMRRVHDADAGIEIDLPAGEVGFARYAPPFAQYDATGDLGVRVLLISQTGNRATLHGLYDIMQTLDFVPTQGPRSRERDRFTLEGRGNGIVSHTQARLIGNEIKGFTLIWPQGDEARRQRVLRAMQSSFARRNGVLDPAKGDEATQNVDLTAGLELREPDLTRSGFYVDDRGTVITTVDAVRNCNRITLDGDHAAHAVASDAALGVAILRPTESLVPMAVARFRTAEGPLQSPVAVSGFSYGGLLGGPTLTHGTLADIKGLTGETDLSRLALNALPGDAGGPVIDAGGGVLGMLLPPRDTNRTLPEEVSLAADAGAIRSLLTAHGVRAIDETRSASLAPTELNRTAFGMTVLVGCWR